MLKLVNLIVGLFGYKYVVDNRIVDEPPELLEADEGYDDIHQHSPRYRLVKTTSTPKE